MRDFSIKEENFIPYLLNVIVLLTRRCPFSCSYCRIVKNYSPIVSSAFEEEKNLDFWKEQLSYFKDKDTFLTILGGEPLLLDWLPDLIQFLNELRPDYWYALVSSGVGMTKEKFRKFCEIGLRNWSFSWDFTGDRFIKAKTNLGYKIALEFKEVLGDKIDLVAVSVLKDECSSGVFEEVIENFTKNGIWLEITLLDFSKSEYYDFAEPTQPFKPVPKDDFLRCVEKAIEMKKKGYLIHNNFEELYAWMEYPEEFLRGDAYCHNPFANLTIDADGKLRLCLRIRGDKITKYTLKDLSDGEKLDEIISAMREDYRKLCMGCNQNCVFMANSGKSAKIFYHK